MRANNLLGGLMFFVVHFNTRIMLFMYLLTVNRFQLINRESYKIGEDFCLFTSNGEQKRTTKKEKTTFFLT